MRRITPRPRLIGLLAAGAVLAGCTAPATSSVTGAPGDAKVAPAGAGPATAHATPRPAPVPHVAERWEPAPVPRLRIGEDRATWNPTRSAFGWPDRFSGAPPGGPFRPRL